ncbi:MAG: DUF4276 family protein [Bryobacteraceae bacterium]
MIRVVVIVEGQTEESFISRVLAPEFWAKQIYLQPILLGLPGHKGGRVNFDRVRQDATRLLKQDKTAYCTTMFDYYGLGPGFPGTPPPPNTAPIGQVCQLEAARQQYFEEEIPQFRPDARFIPYIQLHEYEGLLFSNSDAFAKAINQPQLITRLQEIRKAFPTPEDINDSPITAPSKRILDLHPRYSKVIDGTLAAQAVGIAAMRAECPHFREWLEKLEGLTPL